MSDTTGHAQRSQHPPGQQGTTRDVSDELVDLVPGFAVQLQLDPTVDVSYVIWHPQPSQSAWDGKAGRLRRKLRDLYGWRCRICGGNFPEGYVPHCDHIHPKKHGGPDAISNRQLAHSYCNLVKGGKVGWEFVDEFYDTDVRIACWWDGFLGEWCHWAVDSKQPFRPIFFMLYRRMRLSERKAAR